MSNFGSMSDSEDCIRLDPMEEICGRLESMEYADKRLYIHLSSGTLRFPADSDEAAICTESLADNVGNWVSILRGPFSEQQIVITHTSEQ